MKALACIVCGKELRNIFEDSKNQPYEGLAFTTSGHYGGTVFDPMDGSILEINVCDECLVGARDLKRVYWRRKAKPVMFEGTVVGWVRTPDLPYVEWTGDEEPAFGSNSDDRLVVGLEELASDIPEIDWLPGALAIKSERGEESRQDR